jgi:hypothetical protein
MRVWCWTSSRRYPHPMPVHDAEMDEIVAELEEAGLVETFINDEGKVAYPPHAEGCTAGALDGDGG